MLCAGLAVSSGGPRPADPVHLVRCDDAPLHYNSLDVEVMGSIGYRLELGRFYTSIQPLGAAAVVYKSNPWPIEGQGVPRTEGPFYVGNVAIGWQF